MSNAISCMTAQEKLENLLQDINLAELKKGNQTEVFKFYEQNKLFIRRMAYRFCQKQLNYRYQDRDDLMQEIYVNLPSFDYSSYKRLCYTLWRSMLLLMQQQKKERCCLRLDSPVKHDSKTSFHALVTSTDKKTVTYSDDKTLSRLVLWLKNNLTEFDFKYVYMRYIEFATNDEIFSAMNYSLFNRNNNLERIDFRIMQRLREKYSDMVAYVGGKFAKFNNILPSLIEKRRSYMTAFNLFSQSSALGQ